MNYIVSETTAGRFYIFRIVETCRTRLIMNYIVSETTASRLYIFRIVETCRTRLNFFAHIHILPHTFIFYRTHSYFIADVLLNWNSSFLFAETTASRLYIFRIVETCRTRLNFFAHIHILPHTFIFYRTHSYFIADVLLNWNSSFLFAETTASRLYIFRIVETCRTRLIMNHIVSETTASHLYIFRIVETCRTRLNFFAHIHILSQTFY